MNESGIGFAPMQVATVGEVVASTLTDVLWHIDPHHDKLQASTCKEAEGSTITNSRFL